eukprot:1162074-Pelagomonas_calceolata.AAC.16
MKRGVFFPKLGNVISWEVCLLLNLSVTERKAERAAIEVFPQLHEWLSSHDDLDSLPESGPCGQGSMASIPTDVLPVREKGAEMSAQHSQSLHSKPVGYEGIPPLVYSKL